GLTGAHLWAANGSNEVIQQVQQAFGGPSRRALGFDPGYSMHSLIARVTCTGWISAARDEDFGLDPERAAAVIRRTQPDIVFLTSPNNPTGTAAPMELIEAVCAAAPGLVVIDEAYAEFARGHAERAHPAAALPGPGGHPHDVQGVRDGRRQDRVPGRRARGGREAASRAAPVPPVRGHPGGGARRTGAGRRAAGHRGQTTDRTGRARRLASAAGPFRGGLRRELRAVRRVRVA